MCVRVVCSVHMWWILCCVVIDTVLQYNIYGVV